MAVTLTEKIWKKERAKVEKCLSAPDGGKKKDSRPGSGIGGILIPMGKSTFLLGKIQVT